MNMRIVSIILILSVLLSVSLGVGALEELPSIIDNASLLSKTDIKQLEETAQIIHTEHQCHIVILTERSLMGKTAQEYADDYYDSHSYGVGDEYTGLLLLVAIEEREWYVSTAGKAIFIFSDSEIQELGENAFSYFENNNYADVFHVFLSSLQQYLNTYDSSAKNYTDNSYLEYEDTFIYPKNDNSPNIFLSFIIGIIIATISIIMMRGTMSNTSSQSGASNYIKSGSFHITTNQDIFLYSKTSKTRRQQNTSSSGKTSIHTSSSGRRHGGGGGRF